MEQPQPERRSEQRYAVDAEAIVVMVNHGSSLRGRLVELSLDGCRLHADRFCALAAPANIEVMFKLNGMDFRLGGTMHWADTRQMAGIEFGAMAPRRRDFLVELLSELEAEESARAEDEPTPEVVAAGRQADPAPAPPRLEPGSKSRRPESPKQPAPAPAHAPVAVRAPMEPAQPPPPAASSNPRERRAQTRHVVDSRATIFFVEVRAQIAGCIVDVSLGGCRIRTDARFPVGIYRRVETEFTVDGVPLRLAGVVQSLHDKFNVGIRFLDMSERKRNQLRELIEEIDGTEGLRGD